jgi:hypothetical protein
MINNNPFGLLFSPAILYVLDSGEAYFHPYAPEVWALGGISLHIKGAEADDKMPIYLRESTKSLHGLANFFAIRVNEDLKASA